MLSAYSLDKSVTYFEEEMIEDKRLYHMMQEAGGFFLEGSKQLVSQKIHLFRNKRNSDA